MGDFVGERLREERLRLGLKQEELADIGGVKKNAQFNYEKGVRAPSASYLAAVAAVGVDVNYLLTGQRSLSESDLTPEEQALLSNYRSTPAEKRKSIDDLSEAFAGLKPDEKAK